MATVTMTIEEYEALMALVRSANGGDMSLITSPSAADLPEPKPKRRKRSKYNKELSKQLEKMKKKHPRTKQSALMSKAHAATRKALGMSKRRKQ
jgi:hypothetical protein